MSIMLTERSIKRYLENPYYFDYERGNSCGNMDYRQDKHDRVIDKEKTQAWRDGYYSGYAMSKAFHLSEKNNINDYDAIHTLYESFKHKIKESLDAISEIPYDMARKKSEPEEVRELLESITKELSTDCGVSSNNK